MSGRSEKGFVAVFFAEPHQVMKNNSCDMDNHDKMDRQLLFRNSGFNSNYGTIHCFFKWIIIVTKIGLLLEQWYNHW